MNNTIWLIIAFIIVGSLNFRATGTAVSRCDQAFGRDSVVWSRSFLGVKCLTPDGSIQRLD